MCIYIFCSFYLHIINFPLIKLRNNNTTTWIISAQTHEVFTLNIESCIIRLASLLSDWTTFQICPGKIFQCNHDNQNYKKKNRNNNLLHQVLIWNIEKFLSSNVNNTSCLLYFCFIERSSLFEKKKIIIIIK